MRITGRRGGIETRLNRAWSAGAGCGALGAALALMPWVLTRLQQAAGPVTALAVRPVVLRISARMICAIRVAEPMPFKFSVTSR